MKKMMVKEKKDVTVTEGGRNVSGRKEGRKKEGRKEGILEGRRIHCGIAGSSRAQ